VGRKIRADGSIASGDLVYNGPASVLVAETKAKCTFSILKLRLGHKKREFIIKRRRPGGRPVF
jgi:hypothetical protein